jgi:hypothetical protein
MFVGLLLGDFKRHWAIFQQNYLVTLSSNISLWQRRRLYFRFEIAKNFRRKKMEEIKQLKTRLCSSQKNKEIIVGKRSKNSNEKNMGPI